SGTGALVLRSSDGSTMTFARVAGSPGSFPCAAAELDYVLVSSRDRYGNSTTIERDDEAWDVQHGGFGCRVTKVTELVNGVTREHEFEYYKPENEDLGVLKRVTLNKGATATWTEGGATRTKS